MSQPALAMMQMFLKWYFPEGPSAKDSREYLKRSMVCTPYMGSYGKLSGWVICVNGSPPKGTLVIMGTSPPLAAFRLGQKSQRVIGDKQVRIIRQFFQLHLKGRDNAFEISQLHGSES
jgi:hypothetical protein